MKIGQNRNKIDNIKITLNLLAELELHWKRYTKRNSLGRLLHNNKINRKFGVEGAFTSTASENTSWYYLIKNSERKIERHKLFTLRITLKKEVLNRI